jgi:thiol:disulfide interchange protein DsbA
MEALGLLDKLHRPLFDAIHKNRLRTDNQQEFSEWLTRQGVDAKKFVETVKSFGVRSKTRRAVQLTLQYKIDGTPAMAVNGRYIVPSSESMLDTVNRLVGSIRKTSK